MDFLLRLLRTGLLVLLALLPIQTFFTVWLAQGSSDRIVILSAWKEILTLGLVGVTAVVFRKELVSLRRNKVLLAMAAYLVLSLGYVLLAKDQYQALLGAAVNTRFLLVFGVAYLVVRRMPALPRQMVRVLLLVSLVVAAFGIVQATVLPKDVLTHVGYDRPPQNTLGIPPAYHLVGDSVVVRAQSTLRGPNALGSYLILPLVIAVVAAWRIKQARLLLIGISLLLGLALLLSYSRSAWLGLGIALFYVAVVLLKQRKLILLGLAGLLAATLLVVAFRNNSFVSQAILRQDSSAAQSSNEGHAVATTTALKDVAKDPFGDGLGTAGPASALTNKTTISENYFLQVGQEMGWLGLMLLVAIHGLVFAQLWRIKDNWLAVSVAGAFVGLVITNLLLHTWADEAVAMTWWALAAAVLGTQSAILKQKR